MFLSIFHKVKSKKFIKKKLKNSIFLDFLPLLLLISTNLYLTHSSQDLCRDAKAAGFNFANDPSTCEGYLYCERDASDAITAVHQMICDDPKFPHFLNDGCFSAAEVPCTPLIGTPTPPNPNYAIKLCPDNPSFATSTLLVSDPSHFDGTSILIYFFLIFYSMRSQQIRLARNTSYADQQ